jgi:peptidoglycan/xylan/chitin deacetylase (PgdA/CDA1 family)
MYHVIGFRRPSTPNAELWVLPREFAAEMHALRRAGYHGVTLGEVWDAWHHGGLLPSKPVVVSFDDGYYGQERDALPTLRAMHWPGVLNLKLDNLADMGGPRGIRRLIAGGWEIDSHTITHPDLTRVSDAQLRFELDASRTRLRRLFGPRAARFFCYPSGRYDPRVVAAVRRAGYLAATATVPGLAARADRFALFRVRVNGTDTPGTLLARLRALAAASPTPAPASFTGSE